LVYCLIILFNCKSVNHFYRERERLKRQQDFQAEQAKWKQEAEVRQNIQIFRTAWDYVRK